MTSGAGEDRYTYPTDGEKPQDDARIEADPADRPVSHDQEPERSLGTSADAPGFDPSDRDRADQAAAPGEEGAAGGDRDADGNGGDDDGGDDDVRRADVPRGEVGQGDTGQGDLGQADLS
jgi:hypothetical protein